MTLNGRPDRGLSNNKSSTAKRRTHRSTVVRGVSCLLHDRIGFSLQMQLDELRALLCSQANHARTSQNIVSGRERAAATDVSRMVAVAHTTTKVGMDNTTKTINQPLVRNRSNTTLGEVVGKVGILSKLSARKQTRTLPTATDVGPSTLAFRGGLHRTLAQPCSLNCVQTQKSLITLSYIFDTL